MTTPCPPPPAANDDNNNADNTSPSPYHPQPLAMTAMTSSNPAQWMTTPALSNNTITTTSHQ